LADGAPASQGGRHHNASLQPHLPRHGITAYLENGGTLEKARHMAAHASTRTTQLYDQREDRVTLDEVVKINIRE
jgi:site-specific recombinase XerD